MGLPDRINSEAELEDILAEPSPADVESVARLRGDVLILGASGKMGPSLVRRMHRAIERVGSGSRVKAASRFSSPQSRAAIEVAFHTPRYGVSRIFKMPLDDAIKAHILMVVECWKLRLWMISMRLQPWARLPRRLGSHCSAYWSRAVLPGCRLA